ncbi:hypothetical protein BDN72DRAFT_139483 [Pluteus cervinus]|uniref:Uncharacterized protein n=1 Tax=Pluteus cervinus TaxID=181527 RepID=A0ACD3ALR6_9AGAR|nr:hypothetical protein BDN72DRAFT_139483 [Pluteus cervinus]
MNLSPNPFAPPARISIESSSPLPYIQPTLFLVPVPAAGFPQKVVDIKKHICTSFPALRGAGIQEHHFSLELKGRRLPDWESSHIIRDGEGFVLVPRHGELANATVQNRPQDAETQGLDSESPSTHPSPPVLLSLSERWLKRQQEEFASDHQTDQAEVPSMLDERLRNLEKLSTLCEYSTQTEIKTYTSQSGETVSYIDFDDETLRALRTLVFMACPKKLVIRQEYEEAVKYLESNLSDLPGGACITGQSGIGKSLFLIYLLFSRLHKGLPTAFQTFDEKSYVIVDGKAYNLDDKNGLEPSNFSSLVWALSDSNDYNVFPTRHFFRPEFGIIHAASPQIQRHKWVKQASGRLWIMDLWTKAELETLGNLYEGVTEEAFLVLAEKYGTVPETILELARFPKTQNDFIANLNIGVKKLVENPQPLLYDIHQLNITDGISSSVLHIQPAIFDSRLLRTQASLALPSRYIAELIVDELAGKGATIKTEFFSRLIRTAYFPPRNASWIYDAFIHTIFMSLVVLPCTWTRSPTGAATPESIHGVGPDQAIPTHEGLKTARPPFYWRPRGSDHQGIDAVLCNGQGIFMIRLCATTEAHHTSPIPGISEFRIIARESSEAVLKALPEHLLYIGQSEEDCQSLCAIAAENLIGEEWENVSIGYCPIGFTVCSVDDLLSGRLEAE